MSKYTTGEIAKLCGVSVRTVQYYDSRNILVPSELTEGGRRLYSEDDLKRMRVICFLREAGFPISSIGELLDSEDPESVISLLLDQQAHQLQGELEERQKKLEIIGGLRRELKSIGHFSVESIGDIAYKMKKNTELRRLRALLLVTGIPMNLLQVASIILWISKGIWWPFALWAVIDVSYGIWVTRYYFHRVAYVCPECHEVFKPPFKEMFWAKHTPRMRYLSCPKCGRKGYCLEVYAKKEAESHD